VTVVDRVVLLAELAGRGAPHVGAVATDLETVFVEPAVVDVRVGDRLDDLVAGRADLGVGVEVVVG
jgi:hypothetical protein